MSDEELGEYLAPDETPELRSKLVASLSKKSRATYEAMHKAEGDIMLWQAGLGPRPGNVIICGEKEIRDGRGPGGGK